MAEIQIGLSEHEREELELLLEGALRDLSSEIAGTEHPVFNRGLKERRVQLRAILAKLRECQV